MSSISISGFCKPVSLVLPCKLSISPDFITLRHNAWLETGLTLDYHCNYLCDDTQQSAPLEDLAKIFPTKWKYIHPSIPKATLLPMPQTISLKWIIIVDIRY